MSIDAGFWLSSADDECDVFRRSLDRIDERVNGFSSSDMSILDGDCSRLESWRRNDDGLSEPVRLYIVSFSGEGLRLLDGDAGGLLSI